MWRPRRRPRRDLVDWIPGIRLRISTINGPVVDATSEHLHYSAKFGDTPECGPACRPDCDVHGWLAVVGGGPEHGGLGMAAPAGEFSTVPLKIEIKALRLPRVNA